MRILFNCSNSVKGGGIQAPLNYLDFAVRDTEHEHHVLLSPEVASAGGEALCRDLPTAEIISPKPARDLIGRNSRARIQAWEERIKPDVVLTLYGPAYARFRSPHLMLFADPWVITPKHDGTKRMSAFDRCKIVCINAYKRYWAKQATRWVVETVRAADDLAENFRVRRDAVHTIYNGCRDIYFAAAEKFANQPQPRPADGQSINILVLSAPYPHKNLEIIPPVAQVLKNSSSIPFRFLLTLPPELSTTRSLLAKAQQLGVADSIENIGTQPSDDCPQLYHDSHILFLPTLLEVFSCNYSEAMCMRRPIVTSDRPFARDVCQDAACYCNPLDPVHAAQSLIRVATDYEYAQELVRRGSRRLNDFPSPAEKYVAYIEILKTMNQ